MDPLTAFNLACAIIQVVDFSTKAVKKCRELYKDCFLSENEDVEEMATHLTGLRTRLVLPSRSNEDELLDLGEKCSDTAQALIVELQTLKVNGPYKKRQVIRKSIKALWKKGAIDEIQKRVVDYRKLLDSRVLIDLRKRVGLLSLQEQQDLQKLDQKVQTMIESLAQGPKSFDELKILVHNESESIKQHITNEVQRHERDFAHDDYHRRYLESLWYPETKRREETIKEAHARIFRWIFEPDVSDKAVRQWHSFVEWLASGQGTYWISGKAGSGKSTLMNYIHQDDETLKSLKLWSGTKEVFTPSFFFWNAGNTLEKSSEGLVRSLLHQVFDRYPDLIPIPSQASASSGPSATSGQSYRTKWSLDRTATSGNPAKRNAEGEGSMSQVHLHRWVGRN